MRLSLAIHQFFDKYLPHIKALSPHTIKAYRDPEHIIHASKSNNEFQYRRPGDNPYQNLS